MSEYLNEELLTAFRPGLQEFVLVAAVSTPMKGDESIGAYIADSVDESELLSVLDAQDKPENIIFEAAELKPKKIIIIDSADFGGQPGAMKVFLPEEVNEKIFQTRHFPLHIVARSIAQDSDAKIFVVGIQTKNTLLGSVFSEEVKASADRIISFLNKVY